jgi:hypothetical protein
MVSRSIRSLVLVTDQSRPLVVEGLIAEWRLRHCGFRGEILVPRDAEIIPPKPKR